MHHDLCTTFVLDFFLFVPEFEKVMEKSVKSWEIRKSHGKFEQDMENPKKPWKIRKIVANQKKSWEIRKSHEQIEKVVLIIMGGVVFNSSRVARSNSRSLRVRVVVCVLVRRGVVVVVCRCRVGPCGVGFVRRGA